jgi:hypothetical protein
MRTRDILSAHPNPSAHLDQIVALINASLDCVQCCTACADACLAESGDMDLSHCIRTDLDCADVCATTARLFSRQTKPDTALLRAQLEACKVACDACARSCAEHAGMHEHCKVCAECCRTCSKACADLLSAMA